LNGPLGIALPELSDGFIVRGFQVAKDPTDGTSIIGCND
jgi:hypothetical protein